MDLTRVTTKDLIVKYGLDGNTVNFIGHALALYRDDRYLDEPALDTGKRMKLYEKFPTYFQDASSYIYPLYGVGELLQTFSRLVDVYGGIYRLKNPEFCVAELIWEIFDQGEKGLISMWNLNVFCEEKLVCFDRAIVSIGTLPKFKLKQWPYRLAYERMPFHSDPKRIESCRESTR
ncbi:hypothetical protein GQ457_07G006880 [Hibiscus cannabinus]